jgi:biopolymer transport protein ExbD
MNLHTFLIAGVSALLVSGFAVVAHTSALAAEETTSPNSILELHLALRLDESGEPKLYLDMPASEEFLRLLLNGQEKQPKVFLTCSKGIPYNKVVKVIDRLGSLGVHKVSLDVKHEKAAP